MNGFYVTEFEKAVDEQGFGITGSRIEKEACTSEEAFAVIDLLEQRAIRVRLSDNGYEVVGEANENTENVRPQLFETLDDLLTAVSPKYGERRMQELMSRLSELTNTSS